MFPCLFWHEDQESDSTTNLKESGRKTFWQDTNGLCIYYQGLVRVRTLLSSPQLVSLSPFCWRRRRLWTYHSLNARGRKGMLGLWGGRENQTQSKDVRVSDTGRQDWGAEGSLFSYFWDRVSLCSQGWPGACKPLPPASQACSSTLSEMWGLLLSGHIAMNARNTSVRIC